MRKLIILCALFLAGCGLEYEPCWDLKAVNTGGSVIIAEIDTEERCLALIEKRTVVNFGQITSFTASDEEEQGIGFVLMCVPGFRLVD